ncbi:MAG: DUF973 family protein [Thermoplasmata archaeon]|jgi:hypothetical protein
MNQWRGASPQSTQSGQTAKTLILIGLILQAIGVLVLLGIGFVLLLFIVGVVFLAFAGLGIVWLVIVYIFSYSPTRDANYEGARTPTLVIAILSFLTLGILAGILYIIAYVKLGDAVNEQRTSSAMPPSGATPQYVPPTVPAYQPPVPTAQPLPPARFCSACGAPTNASHSFCPSCGKPLSV